MIRKKPQAKTPAAFAFRKAPVIADRLHRLRPSLQDFDQLFVPTRFEEIHTLPATQRLRQITLFQAGRDQKGYSFGERVCFFDGDPQLFVAKASPLVELS